MLSYKNECKRKLISSCFLIFFCNLFACNMIDNVPNISPGKISPTWISARRSTTKPLKSPFSVTFLLSVNPWSFLNSTNWSPVSVVIFVAVFFKDDLSNVFRLFNIVCRFSESRLWVLVSKLFAMKIWKMVKTTNLSFLILYTWATYFHFAYDTILFSIQKSYLEKKDNPWILACDCASSIPICTCKNILLWIENLRKGFITWTFSFHSSII